MTMNILQDLVLTLFILSSAWLIFRERKVRLGVIVSEGGKKYTDGRQGIVTTIGRSLSSDVRLKEHSVSRLQAVISYNAKTKRYDMTEYGKIGSCSNGYRVASHTLQFNLPVEERCFEFGFIPTILSALFVILQALSVYKSFGSFKAAIPHIILLCFIAAAYIIRADRQPITESVFAILLTYYVDATMYGSTANDFTDGMMSAVIGVTLYTAFSLIMRLFLKIDMDKYNLHPIFRIAAVAAILGIIVLNLALAEEKNGAYNWITVGPITFQPSEIVKLLLAFVLIVPTGKQFYSVNNLIIILGTSITCFVYGLMIKDIGVLLQFGIIFVIAVLIQNTNFLYSILMIVAGIAGCKAVLHISSTAAARIEGWLGEGKSLFESLTASGIFDNYDDYGYQPVHALVAAFKNGGLLGNGKFDVLKYIEAANSDLATSMLAQKHGYLILFLLLGMYIVLLFNTVLTLRQKNKTQQVFTCIGISLMVFAMALNLCGTFGIVALTGVVSPAISDGISAAISYGCLFGVISSTSMSKEYLNTIKKGELS